MLSLSRDPSSPHSMFLTKLIGTEHVVESQVLNTRASVEVGEIGKVFSVQFKEHWGASDAAGLVGLWTEDGDWMSLVGSRRIFRGRDQIEQV